MIRRFGKIVLAKIDKKDWVLVIKKKKKIAQPGLYFI